VSGEPLYGREAAAGTEASLLYKRTPDRMPKNIPVLQHKCTGKKNNARFKKRWL
jgi:hypothetical protein